jgi:hypothetical protein
MKKGTSKASSAKAAARAGADVGVGFGGWVMVSCWLLQQSADRYQES